MDSRVKKIAYFFPPEWDLFFVLWQQDFINMLAEEFLIDLYIYQKNTGDINLHCNVQVINYSKTGNTSKEDYSDMLSLLPGFINKNNISYIHNRIRNQNYEFAIMNEKTSLVLGINLLPNDIKKIYWPTELYTEEYSLYNERFKGLIKFEHNSLEKIYLLLLQDKYREKAYYNIIKKIFIGKKIYMPISVKNEQYGKKELSWHSIFNLPKDIKIVLYNGSIQSAGRFVIEIVEASQYFPDDTILILTGPHYGNYNFLEQLKSLDKKNKIFIYDKLLNGEERGYLYAQSDIGLAFYDNKTLNNELTIMSSDKIATYFRSSLPIITFDYDCYREFLNENQCGIYIKNLDQINHAILRILSNYEFYKRNVEVAYNKFYSLDNHMKNLIKILNEN